MLFRNDGALIDVSVRLEQEQRIGEADLTRLRNPGILGADVGFTDHRERDSTLEAASHRHGSRSVIQSRNMLLSASNHISTDANTLTAIAIDCLNTCRSTT